MSGRGYIPDPEGHVVTDVHHLLGAPGGAGATPKSVSMESSMRTVYDQLQSQSCTGQSVSGAIDTHFAAIGDPLALAPSRQGIYTLGRCIDRAPDAHGHLPPLVDDGAMPNQVMRGVSEWGISSEAAWPFDPSTINEEPSLGELESINIRLDGQYRINATGPMRIAKLRQALAAKYTVPFAVMVDQAFEDWDGRAPLGAPDPRGILGGHMIYALGYETARDGSTRILFANSWSNSWGMRGLGLGNEAFIACMMDMYVLSLSRGEV